MTTGSTSGQELFDQSSYQSTNVMCYVSLFNKEIVFLKEIIKISNELKTFEF
jgi:hypothetical protein